MRLEYTTAIAGKVTEYRTVNEVVKAMANTDTGSVELHTSEVVHSTRRWSFVGCIYKADGELLFQKGQNSQQAVWEGNLRELLAYLTR